MHHTGFLPTVPTVHTLLFRLLGAGGGGDFEVFRPPGAQFVAPIWSELWQGGHLLHAIFHPLVQGWGIGPKTVNYAKYEFPQKHMYLLRKF